MKKKYKYISMVEIHDGTYRAQYAEGRDGHSLSSSGRWTDARLRSSKKGAMKNAEELAAGFSKRNARPFVRIVTLEDKDLSELYGARPHDSPAVRRMTKQTSTKSAAKKPLKTAKAANKKKKDKK